MEEKHLWSGQAPTPYTNSPPRLEKQYVIRNVSPSSGSPIRRYTGEADATQPISPGVLYDAREAQRFISPAGNKQQQFDASKEGGLPHGDDSSIPTSESTFAGTTQKGTQMPPLWMPAVGSLHKVTSVRDDQRQPLLAPSWPLSYVGQIHEDEPTPQRAQMLSPFARPVAESCTQYAPRLYANAQDQGYVGQINVDEPKEGEFWGMSSPLRTMTPLRKPVLVLPVYEGEELVQGGSPNPSPPQTGANHMRDYIGQIHDETLLEVTPQRVEMLSPLRFPVVPIHASHLVRTPNPAPHSVPEGGSDYLGYVAQINVEEPGKEPFWGMGSPVIRLTPLRCPRGVLSVNPETEQNSTDQGNEGAQPPQAAKQVRSYVGQIHEEEDLSKITPQEVEILPPFQEPVGSNSIRYSPFRHSFQGAPTPDYIAQYTADEPKEGEFWGMGTPTRIMTPMRPARPSSEAFEETVSPTRNPGSPSSYLNPTWLQGHVGQIHEDLKEVTPTSAEFLPQDMGQYVFPPIIQVRGPSPQKGEENIGEHMRCVGQINVEEPPEGQFWGMGPPVIRMTPLRRPVLEVQEGEEESQEAQPVVAPRQAVVYVGQLHEETLAEVTPETAEVMTPVQAPLGPSFAQYVPRRLVNDAEQNLSFVGQIIVEGPEEGQFWGMESPVIRMTPMRKTSAQVHEAGQAQPAFGHPNTASPTQLHGEESSVRATLLMAENRSPYVSPMTHVRQGSLPNREPMSIPPGSPGEVGLQVVGCVPVKVTSLRMPKSEQTEFSPTPSPIPRQMFSPARDTSLNATPSIAMVLSPFPPRAGTSPDPHVVPPAVRPAPVQKPPLYRKPSSEFLSDLQGTTTFLSPLRFTENPLPSQAESQHSNVPSNPVVGQEASSSQQVDHSTGLQQSALLFLVPMQQSASTPTSQEATSPQLSNQSSLREVPHTVSGHPSTAASLSFAPGTEAPAATPVPPIINVTREPSSNLQTVTPNIPTASTPASDAIPAEVAPGKAELDISAVQELEMHLRNISPSEVRELRLYLTGNVESLSADRLLWATQFVETLKAACQSNQESDLWTLLLRTLLGSTGDHHKESVVAMVSAYDARMKEQEAYISMLAGRQQQVTQAFCRILEQLEQQRKQDVEAVTAHYEAVFKHMLNQPPAKPDPPVEPAPATPAAPATVTPAQPTPAAAVRSTQTSPSPPRMVAPTTPTPTLPTAFATIMSPNSTSGGTTTYIPIMPNTLRTTMPATSSLPTVATSASNMPTAFAQALATTSSPTMLIQQQQGVAPSSPQQMTAVPSATAAMPQTSTMNILATTNMTAKDLALPRATSPSPVAYRLPLSSTGGSASPPYTMSPQRQLSSASPMAYTSANLQNTALPNRQTSLPITQNPPVTSYITSASSPAPYPASQVGANAYPGSTPPYIAPSTTTTSSTAMVSIGIPFDTTFASTMGGNPAQLHHGTVGGAAAWAPALTPAFASTSPAMPQGQWGQPGAATNVHSSAPHPMPNMYIPPQ